MSSLIAVSMLRLLLLNSDSRLTLKIPINYFITCSVYCFDGFLLTRRRAMCTVVKDLQTDKIQKRGGCRREAGLRTVVLVSQEADGVRAAGAASTQASSSHVQRREGPWHGGREVPAPPCSYQHRLLCEVGAVGTDLQGSSPMASRDGTGAHPTSEQETPASCRHSNSNTGNDPVFTHVSKGKPSPPWNQ